MAKKSSNDIVLSYYDSLLRTSDIELLKGPNWLNDTIIGFYFEYLDKKYNTLEKREILFVSPELTQLLKMSDPISYDMFLQPLGAKNCSFVLFPLNDWDRKDAAGGTHWSLLIYSKPEKTCYHFDSFKGLKSSIPFTFAKNLLLYLCGEVNNDCVEVDCAQQENGHDCGLFVLCYADTVAQHALLNHRLSDCTCKDVAKSVRTKRSELLKLIETLKERFGK